jgi:hypothetical protein
VVLAASVGIFFLLIEVSLPTPITTATVVGLIVFWFLGIEFGLLPLLLECLITKNAKRAGRFGRIWFVDTEEEQKRTFDAHIEASKDNPTFR